MKQLMVSKKDLEAVGCGFYWTKLLIHKQNGMEFNGYLTLKRMLANYFDKDIRIFNSKSRKGDYVEMRMMFSYIAYNYIDRIDSTLTNPSYREVGVQMNRDHATVYNSISKLKLDHILINKMLKFVKDCLGDELHEEIKRQLKLEKPTFVKFREKEKTRRFIA